MTKAWEDRPYNTRKTNADVIGELVELEKLDDGKRHKVSPEACKVIAARAAAFTVGWIMDGCGKPSDWIKDFGKPVDN